MIVRLVKVLVVVAVIYVAWAEGWPWLRERLGGAPAEQGAVLEEAESGGAACVAAASRANEHFADGVRYVFQPPYRPEEWGNVRAGIDGRIAEAEGTCGCSAESCRLAAQALTELSGQLAELDAGFASGGGLGGNPATRQERIVDLLEEARELAKAGR